MTYPGYEHVRWEAMVQKIEPERLFSFTWHPYGIDPKMITRRKPQRSLNSGWKKRRPAHYLCSLNPVSTTFPLIVAPKPSA